MIDTPQGLTHGISSNWYICLYSSPIASSNEKRTVFPWAIRSQARLPIHLKPVRVSCSRNLTLWYTKHCFKKDLHNVLECITTSIVVCLISQPHRLMNTSSMQLKHRDLHPRWDNWYYFIIITLPWWTILFLM